MFTWFSQLLPSSANCSPFLLAVPLFSQLLTLFNQQMFSLFCQLFTWLRQLFNGFCHLSLGGTDSSHLVLPAGILFCQLAFCSASWHLVLPAGIMCSASWHLVLPAGILFCQLESCSDSCHLVLQAGILFCQLSPCSACWLASCSLSFTWFSQLIISCSPSWFSLLSQLLA